jgi:hypothetical protein
MGKIRSFCHDHRAWALVLIALALAIRALVPTGFMVEARGQTVSVRICDGRLGSAPGRIALAPTGKAGSDSHGKADDSCPYTALGHVGDGGTDPVPTLPAQAFGATPGFLALAIVQTPLPYHIVPPLRGPPARIG